jgi:hypothetical protein
MNKHFEWRTLLNLSLVHVVGQVSESMLEISMGCPWVGQNGRKVDRSGKLIKIYVANIFTKICLS